MVEEKQTSRVGKRFKLTAEGRRSHGFSDKARFACVEGGEKAGAFRALDASGKPWGQRWIFHWTAVVETNA